MADRYYCIICDMPIDKAYPELGGNKDEKEMWLDGTVNKVIGNYGSEHDLDSFLVALCDNCINQKLDEGVIKLISKDEDIRPPE